MSLDKLLEAHNEAQRERIESAASWSDLSAKQVPVYRRKRTLMRKAFAQLINGREVVSDWVVPSVYPTQRKLKFEPFSLGKKLVVLEGIDTVEGRLRPVFVQAGLQAGPNYDPTTLEDTSYFSLHAFAKLTLPQDAAAEDMPTPSGIHTLSTQEIIYTGSDRGYDIERPRLRDIQEIDTFTASVHEVLATLPKG